MLSTKSLRTIIAHSLMAVAVFGLSSFAGTQFASQAHAAADEGTYQMETDAAAQVDPAAPMLEFHECSIARIHEWVHDFNQPASGASIMIGCQNPTGGIEFFAQPLTDTKRAARILSIALTAKALNKSVGIDFDRSNTNVQGCSSGNCRNIVRLFMVN